MSMVEDGFQFSVSETGVEPFYVVTEIVIDGKQVSVSCGLQLPAIDDALRLSDCDCKAWDAVMSSTRLTSADADVVGDELIKISALVI